MLNAVRTWRYTASRTVSTTLAPPEITLVTDFTDRLTAAIQRRANPVCVGLDPRWESLPAPLRAGSDAQNPSARAAAYALFCHGVIDAVAGLVPVVKPQMAFFEQLGPPGLEALAATVAYARQRELLVVIDGKRNDIGSTAQAYADAYLGAESAWGGDALTVSPYLGDDSLTPFVDVARERMAGIFVLVKTSNPGGGQFQDLACAAKPIYRHVAEYVEQLAAVAAGSKPYGAVGAVVGATYREQLSELRSAMPHAWLLVPGFGSQGGTARDVAGAFDAAGLGAIVNNSRGILFAHARREYATSYGEARWQDAVAAATREMIDQLRAETATARLAP